jgi:hypothetical protein
MKVMLVIRFVFNQRLNFSTFINSSLLSLIYLYAPLLRSLLYRRLIHT